MTEVGEEKEEEVETTEDSAEKRAQWRKARLESLEEDALQAQIVIEKMSELSTSTSTPSSGSLVKIILVYQVKTLIM